MMFREGKMRESVPYFEKAAALMESDWHNPSMLTSCYRNLKDEENLQRAARMTIDRAQAALAKDPTNGSAVAVGAGALAIVGETDRAKEWVQRALLLDPENLSMRYNLACVLSLELGDHETALDVLDTFFERVQSSIHVKHLEVDPDLDGLRDHKRFKQMLSNAKQRLGTVD
jgi:adenylate cyclase